MFYSVFVLGKKGPLARVWLAAHWDKKITKAQILETNIVESVDSILAPKGAVKLSLRTSSHLLLGIVRIYARKTLYLLQDCQDAAFKIKSAFRPGVVDLPDGKTEAAISAITLPEMLDFINDFELIPEPQLQLDATVTTANLRNITLPEDYSSIHGDEVGNWSEIGSIGGGSVQLKDSGDSDMMMSDSISLSDKTNFDMYDRPALDDGFGGQVGVGIVDDDDDDVFGMTMPSKVKDDSVLENGHDTSADATGADGAGSRPHSRLSAASSNMSYDDDGAASMGMPSSIGSPVNFDEVEPFNSNLEQNGSMDMNSLLNDGGNTIKSDEQDNSTLAGSTVASTDPHALVLEPLDSEMGANTSGLERKRKRRKKIGVAIDEVKTLSGEEMKSQLSDTSDIIANLELAPPNKMLMNWKRTGISDKLFSLPERTLAAKVMFQFYSRNLITSRHDGSNENNFNDDDLINHDIVGDEAEQKLFRNGGGRLLPEFEDMEMHLEQYQQEFQSADDRSRAPKSPARKKRKTEDKENKEVVKRSGTKETSPNKYDKYNHHEASQNDTTHYNDVSSIQQGRDADSMLPHNNTESQFEHRTYINEELPDEEDEDKDEIEDYMLDDYGAPMSVGPVSVFRWIRWIKILIAFISSPLAGRDAARRNDRSVRGEGAHQAIESIAKVHVHPAG